MPHVVVKMWPGRSEAQKQQLADAVFNDVVNVLQCPEAAVSVAVEEISPEVWKEKVHPEIFGEDTRLYRKPGYTDD